MKDAVTFDNYMDLKFNLEDLFQKKVDLVIFEDIKPTLKPMILRSAYYAEVALVKEGLSQKSMLTMVQPQYVIVYTVRRLGRFVRDFSFLTSSAAVFLLPNRYNIKIIIIKAAE